jgi:hypothetical protein
MRYAALQPLREQISARLGLAWMLVLGVCVLQLFGCVSAAGVAVSNAQIPAVPPGLGRVWVLRQFEPGLGVQWSPMTYVNGSPLAPAYAGTAFYRDFAPGTYIFTVDSCTRDFNQDQTLQLDAGMQADLEVQVLSSLRSWGCFDPNTFYIRLIPPERAKLYFSQVRFLGTVASRWTR